MVDGVQIKNLRVVPDHRGRLIEILRSDDALFERFGQVYMTTALPGVVKAWHFHKKQTDHFACISGRVRAALYDSRPGSPTFKEVNEFFMSLEEPILLKVPPFVYHGFKCIAPTESVVINVPTEVYNYDNPDELRVHPYENDIPYDWRK